MKSKDGDEIMSKPDMGGRKDLGIHRIAPTSDIPKQSKGPTRSTGMNIKKKMQKVMKQAKMLSTENC